MILYHVYSDYNVFQAFVHKCRYYPNDKAVLLIGASKEVQLPRVVRGDNKTISKQYVDKCRNLFDKVIMGNTPPEYCKDIDTFEENIDKYYLNKFKTENINMTELKAYTFCSFERFSIFCINNDIPLSVIELEPGMVSVLTTIMNFEKKYLEYIYEKLYKHNLYLCEKGNVEQRICNFDAQEDNADLVGYTDFNVYKELRLLSQEQLQKIKTFYNVEEIIGNVISDALILVAGNELMPTTDSLVNHGKFLYSADRQAYAHNIILDFFNENQNKKLVVVNGINNHYDYSNICKRASLCIDNVPVELVAYMADVSTCSVISALRQDGYCFKTCSESYVEVSTRFLPHWQKFRFFDSALESDIFMNLIEYMGVDRYRIGYYNASYIMPKLFCRYFKNEHKIFWIDVKKPVKNSIIFVNDGNVDEPGIEDIPSAITQSDNSVYLFVNQHNLYNFLDNEIKLNGKICSFTIKKNNIKDEDSSIDSLERRFWIYVSNEDLINKIKYFCYEKKLINTGIEISCLCDEAQISQNIINSVVKPCSINAAKNIVLYGSEVGIKKYYEKLSSKYNIGYMRFSDSGNVSNIGCCNNIKQINDDNELYHIKNAFVLISDDNFTAIQNISDKLRSMKLAFDHSDNHTSEVVSIHKLVAMKRFDYIDDMNNHYMIDERIRPEDAQKITIELFQGKPRYYNEIKIGMIRIINSLRIIIKGDYNKISIGRDTTFQQASIEICQNAEVNIGECCMFSYGIVLYRDDMHNIYDAQTLDRLNYPKNIFIGNHVWLGRECMLLGGAQIGDNCVIGARCVTSSKFQANSVIAGCPGRIVRSNIIWSRDGYESGASDWFANVDRSALDYYTDDFRE